MNSSQCPTLRRITRLTDYFSMKAENLAHGGDLHDVSYNFAYPHQTMTKEFNDSCDGH